MKRYRLGIVYLVLVCITVWLAVIMSVPGRVFAAPVANLPSVAGTYKVNVNVLSQYNYATEIGVEDLGDGKIKAFGRFDGIPLSATGYQTGKTENGLVYDLKINIAGVFNGSAKANFIYENDNYRLEAEGNGTYEFNGMTGQGSATITGQRIDSVSPSSAYSLFGTMFHSPFLYAVLIIILLLVFLLILPRLKN